MARTLLQLIELTHRQTRQMFFDGTFESSGNSVTTGVDNSLKRFLDNL